MSSAWTPERKAKQAEAIRRWMPWKQSTGPRTDGGKTRVSQNAFKGGYWRKIRDLSKELNQLLRAQRKMLG